MLGGGGTEKLVLLSLLLVALCGCGGSGGGREKDGGSGREVDKYCVYTGEDSNEGKTNNEMSEMQCKKVMEKEEQEEAE